MCNNTSIQVITSSSFINRLFMRKIKKFQIQINTTKYRNNTTVFLSITVRHKEKNEVLHNITFSFTFIS